MPPPGLRGASSGGVGSSAYMCLRLEGADLGIGKEVAGTGPPSSPLPALPHLADMPSLKERNKQIKITLLVRRGVKGTILTPALPHLAPHSPFTPAYLATLAQTTGLHYPLTLPQASDCRVMRNSLSAMPLRVCISLRVRESVPLNNMSTTAWNKLTLNSLTPLRGGGGRGRGKRGHEPGSMLHGGKDGDAAAPPVLEGRPSPASLVVGL